MFVPHTTAWSKQATGSSTSQQTVPTASQGSMPTSKHKESVSSALLVCSLIKQQGQLFRIVKIVPKDSGSATLAIRLAQLASLESGRTSKRKHPTRAFRV